MTKNEALTLALEALENHCGNYKLDDDGVKRYIAACDAIEEALAQPEQELVELRAALAETLGDVYVCGRTWSAWGVGTMTQDDFYPAAESDEVLDSIIEAVNFASPPKRPWVGLTDKERKAIQAVTLDLHEIPKFFATAIEAKLKEKNT